jgi:hypothetical protein
MAIRGTADFAKARHEPRPNMQIHPKTYLQLIVRLWHFRVLRPRNRGSATQDASPLLIFIVTVLTLLLAILEVDLHHPLLQSSGPPGDAVGISPIFMSP